MIYSFFGIGLLVFLKLSMVLEAHIFWEKSPSGKNDQKWSKTVQKQKLFKKIMLVCLEFV